MLLLLLTTVIGVTVATERLTVPVSTHIERLEHLRRDFVANVSHELKTPLTATRGLVETMLDDPEMDPQTRRLFLFKVRDHTLRLSSLVSDLLSLSRIESGSQPIDKGPVDLLSVVTDCIYRLSMTANDRGVRVQTRCELSPEERSIPGDPEAIEQALGNLLENAIKYSGGGEAVEIEFLLEGNHVQIDITDRGPGIAAEHLDRIFERFYRVDAARSRALGGTGLGLAIVKHITKAHGGSVSVQSTVGQGSTFTLSLPRS